MTSSMVCSVSAEVLTKGLRPTWAKTRRISDLKRMIMTRMKEPKEITQNPVQGQQLDFPGDQKGHEEEPSYRR